MPSAPKTPRSPSNRDVAYDLAISKVFFGIWSRGLAQFTFDRAALVAAGSGADVMSANNGTAIANVGDVVYAYRFRRDLPRAILDTQPEGLKWRIQLAGRGIYRFILSRTLFIEPNPALITINVPDATPEIISAYALSDEQALLAKVRYNRLVDIFLGITAYSLQNHLRTAVEGIGQIEIDELYVGLDKDGNHYVVPVQAKGGSDRLSPAQTEQDLAYCAEKFSRLRCRAVSAQFMPGDLIAMFELALHENEVRIVCEKHYKLSPAGDCPPGLG
jgi:hypothetical protein